MVDPNLYEVAAEAGKAIVQAMAQDAWTTFRPRITGLLRRGGSEQLADSLEADREATRSGRVASDMAAGRWQARLEALLERHPELAPELSALAADISRDSRAQPSQLRQSINMTGGSAFQAGGSIVGSGNRTTNKKNFGGILAVAAVVAVLLVVGAGVTNVFNLPTIGSATSISSETPCGEYLRAPQAEREQAVQRIAVDLKVSGAGHPFLILNVDDQCGNQLDTPVGEVIARQRY